MSTVAIIDQQPSSQAGIAAELERSGHTIIGIASNGVEGLALVRRTLPDLVVLDLDIPRLGGLDVIRRLSVPPRSTRVLVFTAFPSEVYEHLCMTAGALGFVSKYDSLSTLADAVAKVVSGKTYFNASAMKAESVAGDTVEGFNERFTAREITVLHYLADGMRVKDIAGELAISDRTVSTYKARLLEKTNTHSLVELLRLAAQHGLVSASNAHISTSETHTSSSDQQFNTLFDQIPYPVCLRDASARILAANQAFANYFGCSAADLVGSRPVDAGMVELEHYEYAYKTYSAAVQQRIPYMLVLAIRVKDEQRVVKSSGVPVISADGDLVGMLCTSVDIGEQHRALENLQEQLTYAQTLRKRRGQYLIEYCAGMALTIANLKAIPNTGQRHEPDDARMALILRLQEGVEMLAELVRLEQGLASPISYVSDLRNLTQTLLDQAPAGSLPDYRLHCAVASCWGWIDAERYVQLLRILLLHGKSLGAASLDIYIESPPHSDQKIPWHLRIVGALSALPGGDAQSIRWQLAQQLAQLLNAELALRITDQQALEITLQLQIPTATHHPL
ncbi:response regulator [Pseudomonas sp. H9]|uniref:response regulator n=1 Tax=Pseudomonas sp. H9 TaxID=483968 RepID=UPI0010579156|nr:response regulator [Pseudomonas sp. H9]TDF84006.1 response regulator [Pseudomonas sp. H9]